MGLFPIYKKLPKIFYKFRVAYFHALYCSNRKHDDHNVFMFRLDTDTMTQMLLIPYVETTAET